MKWWPYHSWEIESPLSVDDLVKGMNSRLELMKGRSWWPREPGKPLQGSVHSGGFIINRVVRLGFWFRYYPWFRPLLHGTFIPHDNGTTIRIHIKHDPLVIAFVIGISCIFGFLAICGLVTVALNGTWHLLMPAGLVGSVALLIACVFSFAETSIVKGLLSDTLDEVHKEASSKNVLSDEIRSTLPPLPDAKHETV